MSEHLLDPIRSLRSIDPRPVKAGKIVITSQIADIGAGLLQHWEYQVLSATISSWIFHILCVSEEDVASLSSFGEVSVSFDLRILTKANNGEKFQFLISNFF